MFVVCPGCLDRSWCLLLCVLGVWTNLGVYCVSWVSGHVLVFVAVSWVSGHVLVFVVCPGCLDMSWCLLRCVMGVRTCPGVCCVLGVWTNLGVYSVRLGCLDMSWCLLSVLGVWTCPGVCCVSWVSGHVLVFVDVCPGCLSVCQHPFVGKVVM